MDSSNDIKWGEERFSIEFDSSKYGIGNIYDDNDVFRTWEKCVSDIMSYEKYAGGSNLRGVVILYIIDGKIISKYDRSEIDRIEKLRKI